VSDFLARLEVPVSPAELVAMLRVDQHARWPRGERIPAESYLQAFPLLQSDQDAVLDLIYGEFLLRSELGETPVPEEYARRFPQYADPLQEQIKLHQVMKAQPASDQAVPAAPDAASPGSAPIPTFVDTIPDLAGPLAVGPPTSLSTGEEGKARFQVLRPHARGGIGQVLLAKDEELDREVALKQIQPRFADQPQFRHRFLQEARITGRLEHPGIVPVYGMGQGPDGQPYYAMRFIKGGSLKEAILLFHAPHKGPGGPDTHLHELRQLLNRFIAVCNTMAYAHSKGVIHRDLKPDNIMLGPYGETLVVDWGMAKVLGQPEGPSQVGEQALSTSGVVQTEVGALVGTPAYMSPEQASGQVDQLGPASDIYSLGATLYTLVTGKLPVEAPNLQLLLERVRSGRFVPPRQVDSRVPLALDAIVRKAMALVPENRYASARDLADDLERFLADEPVQALPEPWSERLARFGRRYRALTRAALVTTASIILVVAGALYRDNRQYQMNSLHRDLVDGWKVVDWTLEHLDQMDQKARQLAEFDPRSAAAAQRSINDACVEALSRELAAPDLRPARRERITDLLGRLEARGDDRAQGLQDTLKRRLADWVPVFKLVHPFNNLDEVLDRQRVRIVGRELVPQPAPGIHSSPLVPTLVPSVGNIRLEAKFAPSWSSAPAVGLLLNSIDNQSYRFQVCVPKYTIRHDSLLSRLGPLGAFLKEEQRVMVRILRNNVVLGEQPISLGGIELHLVAERRGGRLSFQVNQEPPLLFDDPFPLPARSGSFGVYWPASAGLLQLEAAQQTLPQTPSPLEQGDGLFAREDYQQALAFYHQQAAQPGDRSVVQEARYKEAMTLKELNRIPEAMPLLRALMDELPTRRALLNEPANAQADDTYRWPLLAAIQLWRLAVDSPKKDLALADQIQDRLHAMVPVERLVALVPAEDRKPILDDLRLRGPRWRVPFVARQGDLEKLKKAIQTDEQLEDSAYERRMTRWRLSDQHRLENDLAAALLEINELLKKDLPKEDLPLDEELAYVRDEVWIQIERNKPGDALGRVNDLLQKGPNKQAVLSLLVERARIFAAQQKWDEAEHDLKDFLAQADRKQVHYADWAEACLLQGFLRERVGDRAGALQAWRNGLPRNFGPLPTLPPDRLLYGVADDRLNITLRCFSQLASLTGEMTETDANHLFDATLSIDRSPLTRIAIELGKSAFSPEFRRAVMRGAYQTPHGRDLARRMSLRQISFRDCSIQMGQLILAEVLCQSAYPGAYPNWLTPEGMEPLTWEGAGRVFESVIAGKLKEHVAIGLLKMWKGNGNPLAEWERLSPSLEADNLRVPGAFAVGRHFLIRGQPEVAYPLFREVVTHSQPDNLFHRVARAELDKAHRIAVSTVGQAAGLPNLWQAGWTAETRIEAWKLKQRN
jgi:serine/threonine protein kinase